MTYGFSTAFANTLFNKIGNLQMQRAELKIPMIQMSYQKKSPTTMRIFFHTLNVAGKYSVDLTVLTTSEWRFELKPKKSYVDIEFDQAPQSPIFIRAGLNKASAKKDLLSTLRLVPTDFKKGFEDMLDFGGFEIFQNGQFGNPTCSKTRGNRGG